MLSSFLAVADHHHRRQMGLFGLLAADFSGLPHASPALDPDTRQYLYPEHWFPSLEGRLWISSRAEDRWGHWDGPRWVRAAERFAPYRWAIWSLE